MTFDETSLQQAKAALREEVLAHRQATPQDAVAVTKQLRMNFKITKDDVVASYLGIRGEVDGAPAMGYIFAMDAVSCLPVTQGKDKPLIFREWKIGRPLIQGAYGTEIPPEENAVVVPNILFMPLVAVDRDGFRLGYGGGYYDRTLAQLKAQGEVRTVGLALTSQVVDEVPHGPHDVPLDYLATPEHFITFQR